MQRILQVSFLSFKWPCHSVGGAEFWIDGNGDADTGNGSGICKVTGTASSQMLATDLDLFLYTLPLPFVAHYSHSLASFTVFLWTSRNLSNGTFSLLSPYPSSLSSCLCPYLHWRPSCVTDSNILISPFLDLHRHLLIFCPGCLGASAPTLPHPTPHPPCLYFFQWCWGST